MSKDHVIATLMSLARRAADRARELDGPKARSIEARSFQIGREDGLREAIGLVERLK